MNLTEVGAQESVQHGPDIEGRLIAALRVPLRWEWRRRCRATRIGALPRQSPVAGQGDFLRVTDTEAATVDGQNQELCV